MNASESRSNNTLGLFFCFISIPDFLFGLLFTGYGLETLGIAMILSAVFMFSLGLYNLFGWKGPKGLLYVSIIAGTSYVLTEIVTFPLFKLQETISFNAWNIYYWVLMFIAIILLYTFRNHIIGLKLGNRITNNFLDKLSAPISKIVPNKFLN